MRKSTLEYLEGWFVRQTPGQLGRLEGRGKSESRGSSKWGRFLDVVGVKIVPSSLSTGHRKRKICRPGKNAPAVAKRGGGGGLWKYDMVGLLEGTRTSVKGGKSFLRRAGD